MAGGWVGGTRIVGAPATLGSFGGTWAGVGFPGTESDFGFWFCLKNKKQRIGNHRI